MNKLIVIIALIGPWFGLIDGLAKPGRRHRLLSFLGWGFMLFLPGYLFSHPMWPLRLVAGAIALSGYIIWRRYVPYEPRSEATMLYFSHGLSVAASGVLAALTLAAFFYAAGFLGHPEDVPPAATVVLVTVPPVLGGLLAFAKKHLRRRFPNAIPVSFAMRGGTASMQRMVSVTAETAALAGGLMWDELIMAIVLTPILWPMLGTVYSAWNLFYLYGMIVLPSIFIYIGWSTLQRSFLRWTGKVRRKELKQFEVYERLVLHEQIGPWLGELIIDYDEATDRLHVTGTVPERHLLVSLTRILNEMASGVDVTQVVIDPVLAPNPWFQLALARQQRHKRI